MRSRMLKSAQNFASGTFDRVLCDFHLMTLQPGNLDELRLTMLLLGFFGIPAENQYNLEVLIESPGYNCTFAPYLQVIRFQNRENNRQTTDSLSIGSTRLQVRKG